MDSETSYLKYHKLVHSCDVKPLYLYQKLKQYILAIYSTVVKYTLFHEKTRDILFFERPQGARKIKFREFSREIKDFTTVEYVVLFNEADGQDTF